MVRKQTEKLLNFKQVPHFVKQEVYFRRRSREPWWLIPRYQDWAVVREPARALTVSELSWTVGLCAFTFSEQACPQWLSLARPITVYQGSGVQLTYQFSSQVFQSKGTVLKEFLQRNNVDKVSSPPWPLSSHVPCKKTKGKSGNGVNLSILTAPQTRREEQYCQGPVSSGDVSRGDGNQQPKEQVRKGTD